MDPLSSVPAQLIQGDRYALLLTFGDYAATDGWSLRLSVAGPSAQVWTSTASGSAHALTLAATETASLAAGGYQWSLRAEKAGGYATTVDRGTLTVLAELATAAPGAVTDYWETLLTAAQAALSAIMAGQGAAMYMVAGRQWQFKSADECLRVIATCERRLAASRRGSAFGSVQVAFV